MIDSLILVWGIWLCILMFGHWVGDFVCQTRWMAENKSKNWWALLAHVTIYTTVMTLIGVVCPLAYLSTTLDGFTNLVPFFCINFCLHFLTDACTSRLTAYMHATKNTHGFFMVIGFDQWLHFVCLVGSLTWMIFSGP